VCVCWCSAGSSFSKCVDGEYRMRHTDNFENVVIVASERLTTVVEDWVQIPPNHVILVSHQMNVLLVPITVDSNSDTPV